MNNLVAKSVKIWTGRKIYYLQLNIPLKEREGPHSSSRVCNVFLAREDVKKVVSTRAPMAALREIRTGTYRLYRQVYANSSIHMISLMKVI